MRNVIALAGVLLLSPGIAAAQTAQDTTAIVQVTTNIFDAMRKRDTTLLRSAFAPEAQLITVATARDGTPRIVVEKPQTFIDAVAQPSDSVWDERTYNTEVRIDGRLATVWMEYDFYLGQQFSHCGVDAFQLARYADGWKVVTLADTRQREGCPKR
jgi:hypothetical protein